MNILNKPSWFLDSGCGGNMLPGCCKNGIVISKIPVIDQHKKMLGIVSMKDIAKDQFSFNYSYVDASYKNICDF